MASCHDFEKGIDRHFAGTISRDAERDMRAHVGDCETCRRYYHRHLVLEAVTATPRGPEQRLAIGLGLRRRSRGWLPVAVPALVAAAAMIVVIAIRPGKTSTSPGDDDMTARGNADSVVGFRIRGTDHEPVGHVSTVSPDDELAFAYAASGDHRFLAVFGVDDVGRFYWYFPAWTDAQRVPSAIRVEPTTQLVELSEAVRHDLRASHHLWIYAAFLDRPWTTVEIEAHASRPGTAMMLEGRVEPRYSIEVTP